MEYSEKVFGVKTVEAVISGSHYIRSLRGFLMMFDIIDMLRWKAFWPVKDQNDFTNVISLLENIKKAMQDHNEKKSKV